MSYYLYGKIRQGTIKATRSEENRLHDFYSCEKGEREEHWKMLLRQI